MRIPLDYHRILGVTNEATSEQISQAYHDRCLQLPRREYGQCAIATRRQLLEIAYQQLSQKDNKELSGNSEEEEKKIVPEPQISLPPVANQKQRKSGLDREEETDTIEITEAQLPGALLLLHELADYRAIIDLAEAYLAQPDVSLSQAMRSDIVLSLALAYLETSLEQWQQEAWETAAAAASQGLNWLRQEQQFPEIEAELATELDKLRPYRILALLAQNELCRTEREQGLQLLKEILDERQGIDGKGDDRSGLVIDDFLRFIQQLRLYLTASEQQELFTAEANRPSAAGIYLTAYVLLARGFAEKQPNYIVEAKQWLTHLEKGQDLCLERAVCALLLSQTEEASEILEQAPPDEALELIQEQSQGSPDLIPGLCWYAERWLQAEVLTHFRDLSQRQISLEDYFADKSVQSYLEGIFEETQVAEPAANKDTDTNLEEAKMAASQKWEDMNLIPPRRQRKRHKSPLSRTHYTNAPTLAAAGGGGSTLTAPPPAYPRERLKRRDYLQELPDIGKDTVEIALPDQEKSPNSAKRHQKLLGTRKHTGKLPQRYTSIRRRKRRWSVDWRRFIPVVALLFGMGTLATWFIKSRFNVSPLAALQGEQLLVHIDQSPIDIPPPGSQLSPAGALSQAEAQVVIENWLAKKSQAFGKSHEIEALDQILTGSILPLWRERAQQLKNSQSYRQYQHQVQVIGVKSPAANRVIAEAQVKETTNYYQQDKRQKTEEDSLKVRYTLINQQEGWMIEDIRVLP